MFGNVHQTKNNIVMGMNELDKLDGRIGSLFYRQGRIS